MKNKINGQSTKQPPKARVGPFARLSKIWQILFLSLPADGIVAIYLNSKIPVDRAQLLAALATVITLPFLNQKRVASKLANLRRWQSESRGQRSRRPGILLGVLLACLIAAKLAMLPTLSSLLSLVVAGILILGIISSVKHVVGESKKRNDVLVKSPQLYVTAWEQQLVTLCSIPMLAARVVSLCGALSLGNMNYPVLGSTYLLTSVVLLLALKPEISSFVGWCRNCKSPTPIAFVEYGSCPRCDPAL